jgi:hypothetical protein
VRGARKFTVPVFAVAGPDEDVAVLGKFRSGELEVANLTILDEHHSGRIGSLLLYGLGGAVHVHQLWNVGAGRVDFIAGERTSTWTTLLQLGRKATGL